MSSLAVRMTVAVLAALVLLCSVVLSQPSPPPLSSRPDVISTRNTGHHHRMVTAMGAAENDAAVIAGTASPFSPATDNTDHHDATAMFGEGGTTLQGSESFGDQCPPAAALLPRLDRVSLKTILRELGVNSYYAFAKISHAFKVPTYPLYGSVPTVQYCNWADAWAKIGTSFPVEKAEGIYAQCDCIAPYVPPIERLGLGRVVRALKIRDPAAVETIATALQMPPCGSVTVAQLCRWLRDHGPQCPPYPHPATEEPSTPTTAPTTPAPESSGYPLQGQSQSGGPKPHPEPSTPAPETEPWPTRAPEETQAPMTYPPRPWPTPAPSSLPAGPSSHTDSAGVPVSLSSVMSHRSSFGPLIGSSASASAATSSAPTARPVPHMPSPAATSAPGAASGPPPALSDLSSSTPRGSQTQSSMSNGAGAPVTSSTHGFAPTSSPDEDGSIPQKHIVFVCIVLGLSAIAAVIAAVVVLCCLRRRCPHKCPMLTDVVAKTGVPKTPAMKKKKAAPTGDNTTAPTSDFSSADGDEEIVMPADFEGIVEGRPMGAVTPPYPPLVLERPMPRPPRATSRATSRAAPSASLRHARHVDVSLELSPQNAQRLAVPGVVFSDTQTSPTFVRDHARDRASQQHQPQAPEAPLQMPTLANDVERSTVVEMTRPQTAPQYPVIQIPLPQRRQEGRSRRGGSGPKVDGKAPKIHPEPQNPLVKRHVAKEPPPKNERLPTPKNNRYA